MLPIQPDVVGHGFSSDHSVPLARPNRDKARCTGFAALGLFLATINWALLYNTNGVDAKLEVVNAILFYTQDVFCPMEEFKVRLNGKYIVSAKLAKLSKLKSFEFKKHRYSRKFKDLKRQCRAEVRNIKQNKIWLQLGHSLV